MLKMKLCAPLLVCVTFINVIRHCRSQAGPFNFLNYQPIDPSMQFQPDLPYPFPSESGFGQGMELQGPEEAFMDLLRPIQPPLFSPKLMLLKNKLCELIYSKQLDVGPVMDYLTKFQHLDEFDRMIAGLLSLRDTLPSECPLRQELGQLIVQAIFKRCQARLLTEKPRNVPTVTITAAIPEPEQQLSCETIASLIRHFESLFEQYQCQECLAGNDIGSPQTIYHQFTKRNSQQAHKRRSVETTKSNLLEKPPLYRQTMTQIIPFEQLLDFLPQPQNQMETLQYNTVKTFLRSKEIRTYFKDVKISDYSNKQALLNLVLNKVVQINTDANIKQAFNYYLHYGNHTSTTTETAKYNYTTLIDLLPQPVDNEEKEKFQIVKSVLSGRDIHVLLKNFDASLYKDRKLLLKMVLKAIATSKLDAKTTEAFTYYLNYQESLTELELYTKKEITKHFELTKIFIDTLDIESLSNEAKLAFKKFFKFISNITRDQIKNFDTWSDVKTKGEFMKALFKYLLAQSFVPQEVKDSITQLEPLVKMVGRGAAPP